MDPQDNEQPISGEGELESTSPAAKRRKSDNSLEEDCEYEHSKDLIHLEWDKKKPKLSTLKELMDATFERRREWITLSCPSAENVLETYPCLAHGKIVSIVCIVGLFECLFGVAVHPPSHSKEKIHMHVQ